MNQYLCISLLWFYLGYGIFTEKFFKKYSALLEYKGELIEESEAKQREKKYLENNRGCFLFYNVHSDFSCYSDVLPKFREKSLW